MHSSIIIFVVLCMVVVHAEDKVMPGTECKQSGTEACSMKCLATPGYFSGYCDASGACRCRSQKLVSPSDVKISGACTGKDLDNGCALKCMMSGDYTRGYCKDNACYCNADS